MISQVEWFLCPDKQGTLEKGQRIQQQKRCISTYRTKDEDKSSRNHNQTNSLEPYLVFVSFPEILLWLGGDCRILLRMRASVYALTSMTTFPHKFYNQATILPNKTVK